jgi:hypothetical protein
MELNVVCWNVKGVPARLRDSQLTLLDELAPDVLLLQELTPVGFNMLQQRGWSGVPALQLLPAGHRGQAKARPVRFSCAALTRDRWRLAGVATDLDAPSPERWLTARIEREGAAVDVGSFACPPGVAWGAMKAEQGRRIAAWLASRTGPTIAGIDRNGPMFEHADGSVQLWPHDAPELLGPEPAHRCRDALHLLFEREPHRREQTLSRPRDVPLAVSYIRGHAGQRQTPCRYDTVYVSEHLDVEDVRYLYDESIAAGSDHAAVATRLTLTT